MVYFKSLSSASTLQVTLDNSTLTSTAVNGSTAIAGQLQLSGNATLGTTILGSLRTVRDYVEGNGLSREIFNYTLISYNPSSLHLRRTYINSTGENVSSVAAQLLTGVYVETCHNQNLYFNADQGLTLAVTPGNNGPSHRRQSICFW